MTGRANDPEAHLISLASSRANFPSQLERGPALRFTWAMPSARFYACLFHLAATALLSAEPWPLIPIGSSWNYQISGTAPVNWAQTNFNDSAWPTGLAELGYGDGDEATVMVANPEAAPVTTYFRRT